MSILRAVGSDMGWAALMSESELLEVPFSCHRVWADVAATASRLRTNTEVPSAPVPDAGKMPCGIATATSTDENGLRGSTDRSLPSRATARRGRRSQVPRSVLTNINVTSPRTATTHQRHHHDAPPTSRQHNEESSPCSLPSRLSERTVSSQDGSFNVPLCSSNFHPLIYPPRPRPLATTASNPTPVQLNIDPNNGDTGNQSSLPIVHISSSGSSQAHGVMARPISSSELWDLTNSKYPVHDVTPPEPLVTRSPEIQPRAVQQLDAEGPIPLSMPESRTSAGTLRPLDSSATSAVSDELQIFERRVYFTRNLESFDALQGKQSLLKVSRSRWDRPAALRFQLTTVEEGVKEHVNNFDVHIADHELVIAHAYMADPAWQNVLYIHRRPKDELRSVNYSGSGRPVAPSRRNIMFICRFQDTQDVADFQQALIGEALVLDISSVRSVRCTRRREALEISNCRIQIWHEDRTSSLMQSDTPSVISNTTRLLSRPAENTRPRYTRVVIFLGRREEYMTFLITDDVELVEVRPADGDYRSHYGYVVAIQPRRETLVSSRTGSSLSKIQRLKPGANAPLPLKVWHEKRTSHAAGFPLGGPTVDFDDDDSYHECQSFEIEFEAEREYRDFIEIWKQAIHFRREKKVVLRDIDEKQGREQFTGKVARRLYFHSLS
ncbi:hypothetical protein QBC37DRAFT_453137 [Rhypophila decipiens]|uniref:Uncharacterized protein n=1 Tax=Rhypophila decipiens TaxID=261697 RepID=A0AAN6XXL0_9PEZI|nr:hypothetical protein QBC37DRAFT_453137 [Rhypophila decipiens]